MKNDQTVLSLEIYYEHLTKINGISFTPREMDIIACFLNNRTAAISSFLGIAPRAVEAHMRNIRQKAGLPGRDHIIDFIEKSDKFFLIKNQYYNALRIRVKFEETLKLVSKNLGLKSSVCLLIYEKGQSYKPYLIFSLKDQLKRIGFEVKVYLNAENSSVEQLKNTLDFSQFDHILYISPENGAPAPLETIMTEESQKLKNFHYINLFSKDNYYLSFFEVLEYLFPSTHFEILIKEFTQQCKQLWNPVKDIQNPQEEPQDSSSVHPAAIVKKSKWRHVAISAAYVSLLSLGGVVVYQATKPPEPSIRPDLILPSEAVLLNRSDQMLQINNKFKGQKGGIQTMALVGIGGAGKTTLARQYARSQQVPVIWEINAETQESLKVSFEKLAQVLAKTEKDKKILKGLLTLNDPQERGEQILHFVRERLKSHKKWLLIYDNVEHFSDIQKYFPQDSHTWGEGEIILTTQNANIHHSKHINQSIQIGELSQDQKFYLFMQTMSPGEKKKSTTAQREEILAFLKKIPPYPLDISVAAYYLKTVNISYSKYLENLSQFDKEFTAVQENLQGESGGYTKTRYGIITLSLSKLIESHKDFGDLLLFISLLDSQNIPKELLDQYKNNLIVDNFIYHLKKYSLITSESSSPLLGSTLSIHRSIQAIALAYLTKTLDLERNKKLFLSLGSTFENYIINVLEKERLEGVASLSNHCEKFLSHKNLLNEFTEGSIESKWGGIYYFLYNYKKAMELLENSLPKLQKYYNKNPHRVAWSLTQLGNIYRTAEKFEDAKRILEQSLVIYKKHSLKDSPDAAFALAHLGNIYRELGDYKKAEILYTQSLLIYKKCFSENHIKVAWNLIHLGHIYNILGDYKKSQGFLEQGLLIYRQHFPEDHAKIGWGLLILSNIYLDMGYYNKAQKLCEQSLRIYKNHSEDSIDVADTLAYLGNIYRSMGKNIEAKKFLENSLKLAKNYFSENHIKVAWISAHLGNVYAALGDHKKAQSVLENSLIIYERYYGKDHIKTAHILENLGEVYLVENNLQLSENSLTAALMICQKNKHPSEYKCLESFSDLYFKKSLEATYKKDKKAAQAFKIRAMPYLKQALDILKANFPADSPHIRRIQGKIKKLTSEKGEMEEKAK